MAAFHFTLKTRRPVDAQLARHFGARRFAYNRCLEAVKTNLEARRDGTEVDVPWAAFDLINWFNGWKRSSDAGRVFVVDPAGNTEMVVTGLSWRTEVSAQVFEEAAKDLAGALAAFSASRRGIGRANVGFPHFKKKGRTAETFRLRNKVSVAGRHSIRVGESSPRTVTLPVIGTISVREDTRRLRRLLRAGDDGASRGRICYATVTRRSRRIVLTLTCELPEFHPTRRHEATKRPFVGVDRGLSFLAVVADGKREQVSCIESPRFLAASLPKLRRASRAVSRKVPGSANRKKAIRRLARLHAKIANRRADFAHKASSDLAKNHGAICLEELAISNLVKNRHLARSIADAAWGELGRQLAYKASWYGAELEVAPRFFPSTRRCSRCGWIDHEMTLAKRTFRCSSCGLVVDRDLNAAANLAAYADAERDHPRTPKREAGSTMSAEVEALAVTS